MSYKSSSFGSAGLVHSHAPADHRWGGYWGETTPNPGSRSVRLQDWSACQLPHILTTRVSSFALPLLVNPLQQWTRVGESSAFTFSGSVLQHLTTSRPALLNLAWCWGHSSSAATNEEQGQLSLLPQALMGRSKGDRGHFYHAHSGSQQRSNQGSSAVVTISGLAHPHLWQWDWLDCVVQVIEICSSKVGKIYFNSGFQKVCFMIPWPIFGSVARQNIIIWSIH